MWAKITSFHLFLRLAEMHQGSCESDKHEKWLCIIFEVSDLYWSLPLFDFLWIMLLFFCRLRECQCECRSEVIHKAIDTGRLPHYVWLGLYKFISSNRFNSRSEDIQLMTDLCGVLGLVEEVRHPAQCIIILQLWNAAEVVALLWNDWPTLSQEWP